MAKTGVRGTGPIELIDSAGRLVALPLSTLFYDDGVLKASGALYAANKAVVDALLGYLASEGLVVPDVQPPPVPAAVITAKQSGAAGNDIAITFADVRPDPADNAKTIFDATLEQRDAYERLEPATIGDVLGTSASTGSPAGLVFLSSSATPTQPQDGTYAADGSGVVKVPKDGSASGNAFQLKFRVVDAAATMTVEVSGSDAATGTFNLVARWTRTVTGVEITALDSNTNFGAMIVVAAPDGGSLAVPAAGTLILAGGADAAQATAASAVAMAQP